MALIRCPECSKEISDKASSCPQCGFPMKESIICVECGYRNKKDEKTCINCGYPFEEQKKCAFCDEGTLDENDYCNSCGMSNSGVPVLNEAKEEVVFYEEITNKESNNDIYYVRPQNAQINNLQQKQDGCLVVLLKIIGTVIAFFIVICVFASMFDSCTNEAEDEVTAEDFDTYDEYAESKQIVTEEAKTVIPKATTQAIVKTSDNFETELQEFGDGEYKYISPADLSKYHANLEGVKFYTVAEVNEYEESIIRITLSDGFMMSTFNCKKDYSDKVQEEQNIAIMGVVGGYNDYGVMGKSIQFDDCMVFAVGEDSRQYELEISDEYFNEYFVVTEDVANSNIDISEEEYKALCNTLDYNDILRNPDSYNGVYCKLNGKVSQIIEGWFGSYSIFIDDYNGNTWGCVYSYDEGEEHLLEGDSVTFYGECNGTTTTETVLGKQVTLPYFEVEYIE